MLRFETYDDAVYAHTDYIRFMREKGDDLAKAWLGDRNNKYGEQAAIPSAWAWKHAIVDAVDADILWLSVEMMDLVQSAMETFDWSEPVTMDEVFIPKAFMVLPHAFMSKDINDKTLGWRMLGWNAVDHLVTNVVDDDGSLGYTYNLAMQGEPEGGVRFMQMSWIWDDDDWSQEYPKLTQELRESGENWGIAHATSIPFSYMNNKKELSGEGDRQADWLLFWRVCNKLMAETIVTKERRHPGRPARRDAKRYLMPPPILKVIELRRAQGDSNGDGEERGTRHYTHRWIVRGHWRNQPYKDGYRQKYIGSYVKGPKDLDLIVKQRVWNWDR